jgi:hypothetical protein
MAAAALELCHGSVDQRSGRIAYSQAVLEEFGVPVPAR